MLAAVLLPLPFAALPIVVVLVGAVFGGSSSEDIVSRDTAPVISDYVQQDAPAEDIGSTLAYGLGEPAQFEKDCGEYDLRSES